MTPTSNPFSGLPETQAQRTGASLSRRRSEPAGITLIFDGAPQTGFRACPVCKGIMLPDSVRPEDELVFTDDGGLVHARCEEPSPSDRTLR